MARRRKSGAPSTSPISIGNCQVIVEAKNFSSESHEDSLEISLSKTAKVKISVLEEMKVQHDSQGNGSEDRMLGDFYFVLANPKESDDQTMSLLQEVLILYLKELPAMNYAANTGKESMFLERCLANGKYCTLLLQCRGDNLPEQVIAAITYQIISADTQHAEVPLAAVNSIFQHKGIGSLLYLELRKRLQSVGVRTIYCWGDKESEGFWLKQGFTVIGEVNRKGRAHRLRIKADIRRTLCFPGGSTLMVSNLLKDSSCTPVEIPRLSLQAKLPAPNIPNEEIGCKSEHRETSNEENQTNNGWKDLCLLPTRNCCDSGVMEGESETDRQNSSCSADGTKKRVWETSCTSLMSKKVKGTNSDHCQFLSHSPVWASDGRIIDCCDKNCSQSIGNDISFDAPLEKGSSYGRNEECKAGSAEFPFTPKCVKVMLMNIADDNKKSSLTKIIENLGGVVTSDGRVSTHIVTGKVRRTLNFCISLCSGSWVVSSGWLKESCRQRRFVDETPFILQDADYKCKYKTELKDAVLRAKANPNAMLKGLDIWLAAHVQPPLSTLSSIVKSAGGNVIRTMKEINDVSKTIFVACEEDMEEALLAAQLGTWTFSADWLMNCIMKQELDLDAPQFAESL